MFQAGSSEGTESMLAMVNLARLLDRCSGEDMMKLDIQSNTPANDFQTFFIMDLAVLVAATGLGLTGRDGQ